MVRQRIGLQLNTLISGYNTDIFNAIDGICRQKDYDLIVFQGGVEQGGPAPKQQQFVYKHINKNNIDKTLGVLHLTQSCLEKLCWLSIRYQHEKPVKTCAFPVKKT